MGNLYSAVKLSSSRGIISSIIFGKKESEMGYINTGALQVIKIVCDGDQHTYQGGIQSLSPRQLLTVGEMELYYHHHEEAVGRLRKGTIREYSE